jgi:limonene 1,2-monooxygenase
MHLAATREQAFENVRFGLDQWASYFNRLNPTGFGGGKLPTGDLAEGMVASGRAVIGTPDDALALIERLEKQSGGFGCFLQLAHNWADFEHTKASYELYARYVAPRISGANRNREASIGYVDVHAGDFMAGVADAAQQMIEKHAREEAAKA